MEITIVTDLQDEPGFTSEFGLSLLLRTTSGEYLFDTGAGTALEPNLRQLGISTGSVRQVILSHGHYDHTGGLASLKPETIRCCPGIQDRHYSLHDDRTVHDISMPEKSRAVLKKPQPDGSEIFSRSHRICF